MNFPEIKVYKSHKDARLYDKGNFTYEIFATEDVIIAPGQSKMVDTGLVIRLPPCYRANVLPRNVIHSVNCHASSLHVTLENTGTVQCTVPAGYIYWE
jgi:dUTPase